MSNYVELNVRQRQQVVGLLLNRDAIQLEDYFEILWIDYCPDCDNTWVDVQHESGIRDYCDLPFFESEHFLRISSCPWCDT